MCELYGVTRAGFYSWQQREPGGRAIADLALIEQVREVHTRSRGYYGSPRVTQRLRQQGVVIGRRRVARLMRLAGLQGRSARRYRRGGAAKRAFFTAIARQVVQTSATNQLWVGDVTYLKVGAQWRYLATVMDRHSRRIVGWSLSPRRDAALTSCALRQAARNRNPAQGLVFHSDRGIEYAANEFRAQATKLGILQSMNRPGKMNDNAHMESFFHSMKAEELYGQTFNTDEQLRHTLNRYIAFYNQQRLHSSLRYLPPAAFEQRQAHQACVN